MVLDERGTPLEISPDSLRHEPCKNTGLNRLNRVDLIRAGSYSS